MAGTIGRLNGDCRSSTGTVRKPKAYESIRSGVSSAAHMITLTSVCQHTAGIRRASNREHAVGYVVSRRCVASVLRGCMRLLSKELPLPETVSRRFTCCGKGRHADQVSSAVVVYRNRVGFFVVYVDRPAGLCSTTPKLYGASLHT